MSRLETIRKKWREHKQIVGQDVDFVLRFTELPPSMESARKSARDDLYMAIMFGPMKGIEERLEATLDRVIAKIAAGVRAHDYETIDAGSMKPSSKIIGNGFTPDDFKDRDGQPASPEAAAQIANQRLEDWRMGDLL